MSSTELDQKFVKNVEEESDEEDEIDNVIDKEYQQFQKHLEEKGDQNRPGSKYNVRPESGINPSTKQQNINEEDEEDQLQKQQIDALWKKNSSVNHREILERLNSHIHLHQISIEQFWRSDKVAINTKDFRSYLSSINFLLLDDEFEILCKIICNNNNQISVENLSKYVDDWKNNTNFMLDFLKDKSLKIAQKSNKKKNLPPTSKTSYYQRPISGATQNTFKTKQSGYSDLKYSEIPPIKQPMNKSNHYLKQHKEKEKEQERLLALTINRGKNEYEYECLIKMGNANELSQQLNSKITYRAYKSADGNLKVHLYDLDQYVEELTLEEFQREYNKLKNRYTSNKKMKVWELPADGKGGIRAEEQKNEEAGGKQINKKERLTELRQVLLETMMLTNILKEQLAVLNKKGINCQAQNLMGATKSNYNASQY